MFLLAKFRETRAYPIILHIVSRPGEAVFDLLGDVVTEDLGAVLASVSGGNDAGLKTLIENPEANEYVRSAALRGLVTLVATDQLSRDEVMEYFVGLFHRLPRQSNYVWSALANHCADLCPIEVREEIRQAYEDGLIERGVIHPHDVQDAIALGEDEAMKNLRRRRYRLIDDVEKEMTWMSGFDAAGRSSGAMAAPDPGSRRFEVVEPHQRSGPKVGRNDPCPCGSGQEVQEVLRKVIQAGAAASGGPSYSHPWSSWRCRLVRPGRARHSSGDRQGCSPAFAGPRCASPGVSQAAGSAQRLGGLGLAHFACCDAPTVDSKTSRSVLRRAASPSMLDAIR